MSYHVKGHQTTEVHIKIDKNEIIKCIKEKITKDLKFDFKYSFIKNGNELWEDEPYYHGSISDFKVRDLTEKEVKILDAFTTIRDFLNEE